MDRKIRELERRGRLGDLEALDGLGVELIRHTRWLGCITGPGLVVVHFLHLKNGAVKGRCGSIPVPPRALAQSYLGEKLNGLRYWKLGQADPLPNEDPYWCMRLGCTNDAARFGYLQGRSIRGSSG